MAGTDAHSTPHLRTIRARRLPGRNTTVEVIGQFAGASPVADAICDRLGDSRVSRFRFLLAFVRWSGLQLLDETLRAFVARGGEVDGVVGLDLGGTSIEALTYLCELPSSRIRVFRSGAIQICFHPKLYLFDGTGGWSAIVGSANGTGGGLFNNAELCLKVEGAGAASPFEDYWELFATPRPPITTANIEQLTHGRLPYFAELLAPYTRKPLDRAGRRLVGSVPAIVPTARAPIAGSPPHVVRRDGLGGDATPIPGAPPARAGELYVEVWEETGGGTQVQFPKAAIREYFGASDGAVKRVDLETPTGRETIRIQIFGNSTFRIPLRFLREVGRPAVLRFERVGPDHYRVTAKSRSVKGYESWLRRCTVRTTSRSKRYGFG